MSTQFTNDFINKSTELSGAGNYPANRLNQRERKGLEVAESYAPAVPGNWQSPPTTQDQALDMLAAANAPAGQMANQTVTWDFSVNGGAVSSIPLGITLPNKAIVVEVIRDILTTADSTSHNGTIQLTLPTDGALEQSALTMDGSTDTPGPANTGGTAVPKKLTAARQLQVTIATHAATSGKIQWFVRYYQGQ